MIKSDHQDHTPIRFNFDTLPLCGAKTRGGGTCKHKGNIRNGRCRLHGGASSGPKNPACGPNNARYTNGLRTKEVIAIRKQAAYLRQALDDLK